MRYQRFNNVWSRAAAALLLVVCTAASAAAQDGTLIHTVELQDDIRSVSILQKFVEVPGGWDVYLVAAGPATGEKTAAVMRAKGDMEFPNGADQPAWWDDFFGRNGVDGRAEVRVRTEGQRKIADVLVSGAGGLHLVGLELVAIDDEWGPCPGTDDAPCRLQPRVIPRPCPDVDQCSGGPPRFPARSVRVEGLDPDGDPARSRALAVIRVSLDGTETGNGRTLGTTTLPLRAGRWFSYIATKP